MIALGKKFTLLLLCIPPVTMTALLSPAMASICEDFPQYSNAVVTLLLTVPSLSIILGLAAGPLLLKRFSAKYLTMTGMLLFLISSMAPAWCNNFWVIFVCRAITGIGCGMVIPLQETYIATYPEKERTELFGWNVSLGCLIAAVLVVFAGHLAEIDWHLLFYLYGVNAVVLLSVGVFLPNHAQAEAESIETKAENYTQCKLSNYIGLLLMYYILLFACYICSTGVGAQISHYVIDCGFGSSVESGILISINMVGCLVAGLIFGKYLRIFKNFAMPMLFVCSTIGFLLLGIAQSLLTATIGVFLIGMTGSIIVSIVNYNLSFALPLELFTSACTGTYFMVYGIQFFGPILYALLLNGVMQGSFRLTFLLYAVIQVAFIAVAYVLPKVLIKK